MTQGGPLAFFCSRMKGYFELLRIEEIKQQARLQFLLGLVSGKPNGLELYVEMTFPSMDWSLLCGRPTADHAKVPFACFQGETLASITESGISRWCGFGSLLAWPTLQLSSV